MRQTRIKFLINKTKYIWNILLWRLLTIVIWWNTSYKLRVTSWKLKSTSWKLNLNWAGGTSRPVASNILIQLFIDVLNWSKISWLFLKFTLENFVKIFFSYFGQSLLTSSFFNKGNSCEIKSSIYFDAIVEMVYFLECFFILQNNY